jgi:hypothetical protein
MVIWRTIHQSAERSRIAADDMQVGDTPSNYLKSVSARFLWGSTELFLALVALAVAILLFLFI